MKRQVRRIQRGFTLIELMIVVAIIAILAAIAVPQYQNYVTRSRWSNVVTALGAVRTAQATCVNLNNGDLTLCNTEAQLGLSFPSGTAVFGASITASGNNIQIDASTVDQLGKCTITMVPTVLPGNAAIQYTYTLSGAGCDRARTGLGS